MNASDWIEMAQMAGSNVIAAFGMLITLMSGYLVVAYLVGEKLTRAQVMIINLLYVIGALTVVAGHSQYMADVMLARLQAHVSDPQVFVAVDSAQLTLIPATLALVNISLITASLYFMWSIRHPRS